MHGRKTRRARSATAAEENELCVLELVLETYW